MERTAGAAIAPLTTLGLGGPARELVRCDTPAELCEVVGETDRRGERLFVLGGGSNVVVADEGFPGVVAAVATRGVRVEEHEGAAVFLLEAGEPWVDFAARAASEGFAGVECLAGIPGLVGATPMQNVGAYGQDVAQVITRVDVLDRESGAERALSPAECAFAYRTSMLKHARLASGDLRYVVMRVAFELARSRESAPIAYAELANALGVAMGARAPLQRVHDVVVELRKKKGMVVDPADPESVSAGSFFTNPILSPEAFEALTKRTSLKIPSFSDPAGVKVAAAWLIEQAGFTKGHVAPGGVGISRKHALALVRREGGTTRALLELARAIEERVHEVFGVRLEREPVLVR